MDDGGDLTRLGLSDVVRWGRALRDAAAGCGSVEEYARRLTSYLFDNARDAAGDEQLVLARFYVTQDYRRLPAELARRAADALAGRTPTPGTRCLTLLGSRGAEPGWNDRRTSAGHQVIPLLDERAVGRLPMISALLRDLGVDLGRFLDAAPDLIVDPDAAHFHVFHVEAAEGSPQIPDQGFVADHQVASALGFGGLLPDGEMFAVVLFSRRPIDRPTAALFRTVGLNVRLGLLPLLASPVLDPPTGDAPPERAPYSELVRLRAERRVLYQLLDAQEQTALTEAGRAAAALRMLSDQADRSAGLARTLQDSLLPSELPDLPGVATAAIYRPAGDGSEVGGDFYDLFPVRSDTWGLVIGDVSGKGAGAAALTALARHTVRAASFRKAKPVDVLRALNEAAFREHENTERYLTATFGALSARSDGLRIRLANAGHPPALVLRRGGEVESHGEPALPLGMFARVEPDHRTVDLHAGDTILLHTDGVTDARNPRDGLFGEDRLVALLGTLAGCSARVIAERVADTLLVYQHGWAADDTALLVLQVTI